MIKKALHDLCSSPHVIVAIASRGMRWVGHVARMGEERRSRFWGG